MTSLVQNFDKHPTEKHEKKISKNRFQKEGRVKEQVALQKISVRKFS